MAAMKPRTGDGPLEVVKEGRAIIMRVPLEGGGRLVLEITADEVKELGEALANAKIGMILAPGGSRVPLGPRRRGAGGRVIQPRERGPDPMRVRPSSSCRPAGR